jgi:hypothetical protein
VAAAAYVAAHQRPQYTPPPPAPAQFAASVITNQALARAHFTPKRLYADNARRLASQAKEFQPNRVESDLLLSEALTRYDGLGAGEKAIWEQKARQHDIEQPFVLKRILECFKSNASSSFEAVAGEIDHWCSGETIRQLYVKCDYKKYVERVVPIVGPEQKKENLAFARRLRSNWNQGPGKYLVINIDEKWMVGMLARHAKMCELLGLPRTHLYAQHKNHITKLMVLAITGYAFEDHFENGGTGVLLGLHRIVAAKIARKAQNARGRKADGSMGFPAPGKGWDGGGVQKRAMGDPWMVPAAITGSNSGTSDNPKFSLLQLFKEVVFPQLVKLTEPTGALFFGYTVVWQWDNAGPHVEAGLMKYVTPFCRAHGWLWEPQGPQMPIANTCDLYVFPLMSRWHAYLCRKHGKAPVSPDVIWQNVKAVWTRIPSANIAAAHVMAYRVMEKVIKAKGGNEFITNGMHCGVRRDFVYTNEGIRRKDQKKLKAPDVIMGAENWWERVPNKASEVGYDE